MAAVVRPGTVCPSGLGDRQNVNMLNELEPRSRHYRGGVCVSPERLGTDQFMCAVYLAQQLATTTLKRSSLDCNVDSFQSRTERGFRRGVLRSRFAGESNVGQCPGA
eukprot:scaffold2927_cov408-Prasinococcus_capsulatus_cf.AAC.16